MHSNKKILTSKNSPWLLCPSKSFPGKFYYFNGSTGETAWSLNDPEIKNLKKASIRTVTDKTHTYPEPNEPPAEDSTSSSIRKDLADEESPNPLWNNGFGNILNIRKTFNTQPSTQTETNFSHLNHTTNFTAHPNLGHSSHFSDNVGNHRCSPSPMFSQAVFPKYVPEASIPKVIWALTPMLFPEQPTQKIMLDQITQYEPQELFTDVPLTDRFGNCKNPFQFTSTPLRKEVPTFDQMLAQRCNSKKTFDPKPQTKDEGCQTLPKARIRAGSLSESIPKTILKRSRSVENLNVMTNIDKTSSPTNEDPSNTNKLSALNDNDLRFLLVAKRRQSLNLSDSPKSIKELTKKKKPLDDVMTKKRVTFALDDQVIEIDEAQCNGTLSPDSSEMECLEPSGDISGAGNIWYIVVDTSVLLAGFECLEQFALSDKNCRIFIPYIVKIKIESLSKGDCIANKNTLSARQLLRKLATPNTHIVVQREPETVSACEEDAVLKCCWRLFQESEVVLITDNTKLYDKAKIIDIECHTFEEFKKAIKHTEPRDPFDWKKVQITVKIDDKPTQNLFQEALQELNHGSTPNFDYPARTLFDNQKPHIDRIIFGDNVENDKLINLTNTKKALKHLCLDVDEINQDISRLEITEQMVKRNQSKNILDNIDDDDEIRKRKQNQSYQFRNGREIMKISGITKLDSVFDLDDELERFYIKSDVMENRIKSRRDEWICRLTQIMEDALTDYLVKERVKYKKMVPPWSLFEAVQVLGEKFKNESKIKTIVNSFGVYLFKCSNNGKLNQSVKPIHIIKMIGFCMILIQNLKETIDCIELNEADDRLSGLIKNIEDPETDIEFNLESVITPVLGKIDEMEPRTPMTYLNKQAEVLEYLKTHYEGMRDYEIEQEPKIVRTTGRDLNTLKISNNKDMSVENVENVEVKKKVEPKLIRNVNVIDAYEEKMKMCDILDYEDTETVTTEHDDVANDETVFISNEETTKVNGSSKCSVIEETLTSTLYNECVLACPLMKTFLSELRRTLMQIYNFISESIQDCQDRELYEHKKADIHIKAGMAHKFILKITDRLQSLIARETGSGTTVKDLLIIAGDYDEEDESMVRYKDVVSSYLEQASILEDALNSLLNLGPL